MSKAFTKEDDASGTTLPARSSALVPTERFHLTREGARRLAEHPEPQVRAALELADILDPPAPPPRAILGVIVHTRNASGDKRAFRLVSHEEQLLLGDGCSPRSPLGRALLGAEVGDVRDFTTPRGREELEVLALSTDVETRAPRRAKTVAKPVAKPAAKKKGAKAGPRPAAKTGAKALPKTSRKSAKAATRPSTPARKRARAAS